MKLEHCIFTPWNQRQNVWDWAEKNNITIEFWGTQANNNLDLWNIENDKERMLFAMRWL